MAMACSSAALWTPVRSLDNNAKWEGASGKVEYARPTMLARSRGASRPAAISSNSAFCLASRKWVSGAFLSNAFSPAIRKRNAAFSTRKVETIRAEAGADEKTPFGYTRKDVLLIGLGVTVFGVALKYGLEFAGVDPLQAGNVVQITLVLGLMVGWTATYVFRVGNKEMTYVKQLKDYEDKVMQKRLEELPEAELEAMLAEIEEEKLRIKERRAKKMQG